jgi:hypothetical protein
VGNNNLASNFYIKMLTSKADFLSISQLCTPQQLQFQYKLALLDMFRGE